MKDLRGAGRIGCTARNHAPSGDLAYLGIIGHNAVLILKGHDGKVYTRRSRGRGGRFKAAVFERQLSGSVIPRIATVPDADEIWEAAESVSEAVSDDSGAEDADPELEVYFPESRFAMAGSTL